MKKYLPLLKALLGGNLVVFAILALFIYYDIRAPGVFVTSLRTTRWDAETLVIFFFSAQFIVSVYIVVSVLYYTKSIADLNSRLQKKCRFKTLNDEAIVAYFKSENYAFENGVYFKKLDNKNVSKIKIKLSSSAVEIELDNSSFINFQMDKNYCEEINRLRINCIGAIGSEI